MRPTHYNLNILQKAKDYLVSCVDEEFDWTKTDGTMSTSYEHRIKVRLPSIEGLAKYLGVARSTIYLWEKDYPEFSDILENIKSEQAERLINNGLSGDYNPTISKLILTKHGYSDKQEISGADGKDLFPVPILNNMNVHNNTGDAEDKPTEQENTGSAGGNVSQ